jgi:Ca2+/Na+ antiporter
MEKLNLKRYQYLFGIVVLLTGILLFVLFSDSLRYLGVAFIAMAYMYFVFIVYSKFTGPDDDHFRSRLRDDIWKYQFRK